MFRARGFAVAAALILLLSRTASAQNPEGATGREAKTAVFAAHDMVVAADPLAAEAGRAILRQGGNAIDAAIATALVLNLVEPQSSGLGGGGFLVFYDAAARKLTTFDGRETAPAATKPDRFLKPDGTPLDFFAAVVGGRSIGVPGYLRMLALAHREHGRLAWKELFAPAIALARDGFPVSDRLHLLLARDPYLPHSDSARGYFYDANGAAWPTGSILKNPALAATLETIAAQGADALYDGAIGRDIVRAVASASPPGDLAAGDLAAYRAKERVALCGAYRDYRICGMGPPSSGAVTMLELLGMLERFPPQALDLTSVAGVHLFAEAGRLAFADRDRYLADTDFVTAPIAGLLDRDYLRQRSLLIDPARDPGVPVAPGEPPEHHAASGDNASPELPSTSHLAIVDRDGNAVSMTVSIENVFGSRVMVDGFLLNNELTDFSFLPDRDGKPVANRVEPGKRPRSAMSPTIIFDHTGALRLVVGSAGGPAIIEDVTKTVIEVLDQHRDLQAAIDLPDIGNRNGVTEIEAGPGADALADGLKARGHDVKIGPHASGLHGIAVTAKGLEGAADSRRDGAANGD